MSLTVSGSLSYCPRYVQFNTLTAFGGQRCASVVNGQRQEATESSRTAHGGSDHAPLARLCSLLLIETHRPLWSVAEIAIAEETMLYRFGHEVRRLIESLRGSLFCVRKEAILSANVGSVG